MTGKDFLGHMQLVTVAAGMLRSVPLDQLREVVADADGQTAADARDLLEAVAKVCTVAERIQGLEGVHRAEG